MSELFLYTDLLDLNDYSEADLMHEVWPFIYKAFKDNNIKAMLGERSSVSVAIGRNETRSLEVVDKRQRKKFGAKVDILFKQGSNELGACEAGKDTVTVVEDKYLDNGLVKLPKTLRDMLSALILKNPTQVNSLETVGFLLMGMSMQLIKMDVPSGKYTTRISRTAKIEFPSSLETFDVDFLHLLEITWKGENAKLSTSSLAVGKSRQLSYEEYGSNSKLKK